MAVLLMTKYLQHDYHDNDIILVGEKSGTRDCKIINYAAAAVRLQ